MVNQISENETVDIKLIAFDLDGTITQHKEKLKEKNKLVLDKLSSKYKLMIIGAGYVDRIFKQLNKYPLDIIGNYGMQYGKYDQNTESLVIIKDFTADCDKASVEKKVTFLRNKYGYDKFRGDNVEYHPSGCITFPLLGTKAYQEDKLSFDPDRVKRRAILSEVKNEFTNYNVFVGGSSSFDIVPKPYDKYYALDLYCKENGLEHKNVIYVGDDYGLGGNDEPIYNSDFKFIVVNDYNELEASIARGFHNYNLL